MIRTTIRFRDNARATVATLAWATAFTAAGLAPAGRVTADPATPVVEVTNLGLHVPFGPIGPNLVMLDGGLTALLVGGPEAGLFDSGGLHLYDPATGILTNLGIVGSELLALDDDRLAINVVEFFEGVDLNGDGDLSDPVIHVYDPATGTIANLGLVPHPGSLLGLALDGGGLAIRVFEPWQGADLNGDGDLSDTVVHVHDPATGTTTNLGIDTLQVLRGLHGGTIGLTLSELSHGIDLNGDGDTDDPRVAHIHDPATGITTNLGLAVRAHLTAVGNDSVAFFVSELGQGEDLNGDGDIGGLGEFGPIDSLVLHLHDQVTGVTTNLGVSGSGLRWLGEGGVLPLPGGAFMFLRSERVTGIDLNGDGDTLDGVVHVHDPTTGATTNLGLEFDDDEETPNFGVLDDGRLAFTVREFQQGADLNGNGDVEGTVIHLYDPATGTTVNTGLASNAEGLVGLGSGDVVAFAVIEHWEGDLNGDGDISDNVVHLMDLSTGELANIGITGSDLLQLTDGTLAISAREFSNADLNGDGDTNDIVTVVYNPTTGQTANVGIAGSPWRGVDLETFTPFPTDPFPGDEFLLLASEPGQGVDLNGDGDTKDFNVLHLVAIDWGTDSDDAPPLVSDVSATPNPVPIGTPIELTATVDDTETGGSVIAAAAYSIDGAAAVAMEAVDGGFDEVTEDVAATLPAFTTAGVHEVCVAGIDAAGNVSAPECIALAVFDPAAGFVTGGGWIDSPAGAYPAEPDAAGKASFGFVSKYHDGALTPDGQTQFRLRQAELTFHSEAYETLVVTGAEARYGGSGRLDGNSGYGFLVAVIDGDLAGDGIDRFRLKIWQTASGTVIYDSQPGDADTASATTPLGGGNIAIHTQ